MIEVHEFIFGRSEMRVVDRSVIRFVSKAQIEFIGLHLGESEDLPLTAISLNSGVTLLCIEAVDEILYRLNTV